MIVFAVGSEGSGKEFGVRFGMTSLAAVAQWTECWPVNQRVTGLIPEQGTCLSCGPGPQMGVHRRQPIDVSLAHPCFFPCFLPPSPSLFKPSKLTNIWHGKVFF